MEDWSWQLLFCYWCLHASNTYRLNCDVTHHPVWMLVVKYLITRQWKQTTAFLCQSAGLKCLLKSYLRQIHPLLYLYTHTHTLLSPGSISGKLFQGFLATHYKCCCICKHSVYMYWLWYFTCLNRQLSQPSQFLWFLWFLCMQHTSKITPWCTYVCIGYRLQVCSKVHGTYTCICKCMYKCTTSIVQA